MGNILLLAAEAPDLGTVVTAEMFAGITSQIYSVLPIILPVVVGLMALEKGVSFMKRLLRGA